MSESCCDPTSTTTPSLQSSRTATAADDEATSLPPSANTQHQQQGTATSIASCCAEQACCSEPNNPDNADSPPLSLWHLWTRQFGRELLAEFIGTGIIVHLGTGAVMSDIFGGALLGLWQVAAVWIIAVTLAIATTGPISGAHLNPAISLSFAIHRPCNGFGWIKVLPYVTAQTLGAVFFSWMNYVMYAPLIREFEMENGIVRGEPESVASAKAFGEYYLPPITTKTAFFAEAFGTAGLAFVIFSLTHQLNDTVKNTVYIPPLIGMTVGGLICVIAPLTQAGFNPARDFGPRIVALAAGWGPSVAFQNWWVYVVAPCVGGPIGAAVADVVLYGDEPPCTECSTWTAQFQKHPTAGIATTTAPK